MPISLTGPTAAVTSTSGLLTAATFSFTADNSNDLRTKVFSLTAQTGATGAALHSVASPKQVMFKRPANYSQPSKYNTVTGLYGVVPKNNCRVIGKFSAKVAANQWENLPISLDIGIPAGATTYDAVDVEQSIAAFLTATLNQLPALIQAQFDGRY